MKNKSFEKKRKINTIGNKLTGGVLLFLFLLCIFIGFDDISTSFNFLKNIFGMIVLFFVLVYIFSLQYEYDSVFLEIRFCFILRKVPINSITRIEYFLIGIYLLYCGQQCYVLLALGAGNSIKEFANFLDNTRVSVK